MILRATSQKMLLYRKHYSRSCVWCFFFGGWCFTSCIRVCIYVPSRKRTHPSRQGKFIDSKVPTERGGYVWHFPGGYQPSYWMYQPIWMKYSWMYQPIHNIHIYIYIRNSFTIYCTISVWYNIWYHMLCNICSWRPVIKTSEAWEM